MFPVEMKTITSHAIAGQNTMPKSLLKSRTLLLVSIFIILSDILFIVVNYYSSRSAVDADIRQWSTQVNHVFNLTMDSKAISMQQIAAYVANTTEVQNLFLQSKKIYEDTTLKDKSSLLNKARNDLHEFVQPGWQNLTSQYDVRQLHFHFGPGSTSFLRVHRPEKFGDNMDTVRYTVVDVNTHLHPVRGFETGRVYSGIRGVVPVFATIETGETVHVGALEAGTSFTNMLEILSNELDSDLAILLHKAHVEANMWPDFIRDHFSKTQIAGDFFLESFTEANVKPFLETPEVLDLLDGGAGHALVTKQGTWQVCAFSLRDYRGATRHELPDAGVVVVWKDASEKWALFRKGLITNIVYSIFALFAVEGILVIGWNYSQRRLQWIIDTQTDELQRLATIDSLTKAFNHGHIEKLLRDELERAQRYNTTFSVIMFDVDHFKMVNDTHGHVVGDEVLSGIANRVHGLVRQSDRLGRWGGEEFLLVATQSALDDAFQLAERLRDVVAATPFGTAGTVTISLGVTQHKPGDDSSTLITRADQALYQAKHDGRNRTVSV